MASSISKRQQARNERALQDLIKNVQGNNVCADCQARNPGWASWSLGIFLCMRCAAIHRKLGTHISKVKSLSMDSWTNEQVENMKRTGNVASNKIYNPQNTKPPVLFDADEADSAMGQYIRLKYEAIVHDRGRGRSPVAARHHSDSTESDEPPPPPPKNGGSRFGFRSASSIFPISSKSKREAAARARLEASTERRHSPPPNLVKSKPSRTFGASVASGGSKNDDMDAKLAKLREMGFTDEKRNVTILRGLSGNLEKAIETLARLGESSGTTSRSRSPLSATAGITIERIRESTTSPKSNNPWDIPAAQPQSSQSTGTLTQARQEKQQTNGNPYPNSNGNPFRLSASQSQYSLNQQYNLDQSVQAMSLTQTQSLFPNHTGGFPNRQPFQAATAPPMPTIPQNYPSTIFDPPTQQTLQSTQTLNPFLQRLSQMGSVTPVSNEAPSSNPYTLQQSHKFAQIAYYDQPIQQNRAFYDANQHVQSSTQHISPLPQQQNNPFLSQQQSQQYMQLQSPQIQQQKQPQLLLQQTGRTDKQRIMELYNYPQLAPNGPQQLPPINTNVTPNNNQNQKPDLSYDTNQTETFLGPPLSVPQQRSVSSPFSAYASGSRNPFMNGGSSRFAQGETGINAQPASAPPGKQRHITQESIGVDLGGWHGQNGRHSPDAFASLSARSMR